MDRGLSPSSCWNERRVGSWEFGCLGDPDSDHRLGTSQTSLETSSPASQFGTEEARQSGGTRLMEVKADHCTCLGYGHETGDTGEGSPISRTFANVHLSEQGVPVTFTAPPKSSPVHHRHFSPPRSTAPNTFSVFRQQHRESALLPPVYVPGKVVTRQGAGGNVATILPGYGQGGSIQVVEQSPVADFNHGEIEEIMPHQRTRSHDLVEASVPNEQEDYPQRRHSIGGSLERFLRRSYEGCPSTLGWSAGRQEMGTSAVPIQSAAPSKDVGVFELPMGEGVDLQQGHLLQYQQKYHQAELHNDDVAIRSVTSDSTFQPIQSTEFGDRCGYRQQTSRVRGEGIAANPMHRSSKSHPPYVPVSQGYQPRALLSVPRVVDLQRSHGRCPEVVKDRQENPATRWYANTSSAIHSSSGPWRQQKQQEPGQGLIYSTGQPSGLDQTRSPFSSTPDMVRRESNSAMGGIESRLAANRSGSKTMSFRGSPCLMERMAGGSFVTNGLTSKVNPSSHPQPQHNHYSQLREEGMPGGTWVRPSYCGTTLVREGMTCREHSNAHQTCSPMGLMDNNMTVPSPPPPPGYGSLPTSPRTISSLLEISPKDHYSLGQASRMELECSMKDKSTTACRGGISAGNQILKMIPHTHHHHAVHGTLEDRRSRLTRRVSSWEQKDISPPRQNISHTRSDPGLGGGCRGGGGVALRAGSALSTLSSLNIAEESGLAGMGMGGGPAASSISAGIALRSNLLHGQTRSSPSLLRDQQLRNQKRGATAPVPEISKAPKGAMEWLWRLQESRLQANVDSQLGSGRNTSSDPVKFSSQSANPAKRGIGMGSVIQSSAGLVGRDAMCEKISKSTTSLEPHLESEIAITSGTPDTAPVGEVGSVCGATNTLSSLFPCGASCESCRTSAVEGVLVYELMFKRGVRVFLLGDNKKSNQIHIGDHMKVEADRGEDLGTVHRVLLLTEHLHTIEEEMKIKAAKVAENGGGGATEGGKSGEGGSEKKKRGKSKLQQQEDGVKQGNTAKQQPKGVQGQGDVENDGCPVKSLKKILRLATQEEIDQLSSKAKDELNILRVCRSKVRNRSLPMRIVDAEYQFDQHKLILYFEAERRIDFRELVRDLFAVYKTRIWMQQVKDKDINKDTECPLSEESEGEDDSTRNTSSIDDFGDTCCASTTSTDHSVSNTSSRTGSSDDIASSTTSETEGPLEVEGRGERFSSEGSTDEDGGRQSQENEHEDNTDIDRGLELVEDLSTFSFSTDPVASTAGSTALCESTTAAGAAGGA